MARLLEWRVPTARAKAATWRSRRETKLRNVDFSSWQSVGTTLLGLALFAMIGVGVRLLMMLTIQQRRERMNRQINERLRTLIAGPTRCWADRSPAT